MRREPMIDSENIGANYWLLVRIVNVGSTCKAAETRPLGPCNKWESVVENDLQIGVVGKREARRLKLNVVLMPLFILFFEEHYVVSTA